MFKAGFLNKCYILSCFRQENTWTILTSQVPMGQTIQFSNVAFKDRKEQTYSQAVILPVTISEKHKNDGKLLFFFH